MTDDIVVDRPTCSAGITALRAQRAKFTDAGREGAALFDKVTAALAIAIPGQPAVEVPTGGADVIRQQAAALSKRAGEVSASLETWMNGELGIDDDGAVGVQNAGGDAGSKPADPAPAPTSAKPADPAPAPAPTPAKPTNPLTPDPGTPAAFSMK